MKRVKRECTYHGSVKLDSISCWEAVHPGS
uniref:Uncharacterized protein n=1 Tax=Arundo donax TaxID=35708 RepID=A0A0A9H9N0_ARUDO